MSSQVPDPQSNLGMLQTIAGALENIDEKFVFVGGATTALYVGEDVGPHVRPTDDVDCIVELTSTQEFYKLDKKLQAGGFKNLHRGPLCRMSYQGITVDFLIISEGYKILAQVAGVLGPHPNRSNIFMNLILSTT